MNNPKSDRTLVINTQVTQIGHDAPVAAALPVILDVVIESELGRGGMGVVYKGRQGYINRPVAVKLLLRPHHANMLLAQRFHHAVERLVGRALPPGQLQHHVAPQDQTLARTILQDAGVDLSQARVAMSPGAAWLTKRWPATHFRDVARGLAQRPAKVAILEERKKDVTTSASKPLVR